ncbi:MAG: hypothetical protein LBH69_01345 [Methanomassiliicoccaceae archaeon]|jgi:hypothetical protein|nr:hypothetical protein [Methanomassiliicoccaceae archaeon]
MIKIRCELGDSDEPLVCRFKKGKDADFELFIEKIRECYKMYPEGYIELEWKGERA